MSDIPKGWALEPLFPFIESKSGNSKIIKGKQSSAPNTSLFPGFSASGQDIWVKEAEYEGDGIVVSAVGARCGKTFIASGEWTAIANTHVLRVKTPDRIDLKWLWFLTNNEEWWIKSGTAQPFVKVRDTLQRPQLVPPLSEQKHIVETLEDHLSRLDKAAVIIRETLSRNEVFRKSVLERALFSKSTNVVPLGKLGSWHTGATPKTSNKLFEGVDVPFVTPGDVPNGGEIRDVNRYISGAGADSVRRIEAPSVQLVCIGATLGKVGVSRQEVTTNQQINSLQPDRSVVEVDYAHWLLASQRVQELLWGASSSTTVPILNKGALTRIEVPILDKESQRNAVDEIQAGHGTANRMDNLLEGSLENLGQIRRSLLHAAFTGQLTKEDSND